MAKLVAFQSGLALYRVGDLGVVVNTDDCDVLDPQPIDKVLSNKGWRRPNADFKANPAWEDMADGAAASTGIAVIRASGGTTRTYRVPKRVQDTVKRAIGPGREAPPLSKLVASGKPIPSSAVRRMAHLSVDPMHGGSTGQAWARRTVELAGFGDDELLLPGDEGDDVANAPTEMEAPLNEPHEFCASESDPLICSECGKDTGADVHVDTPNESVLTEGGAGAHEFIDDGSGTGLCDLCGLAEDADSHVLPVAADPMEPMEGDLPEEVVFYGILNDNYNALEVIGLERRDPDGDWKRRYDGDWHSSSEPAHETPMIELSGKHLQLIAAEVDKHGETVPEDFSVTVPVSEQELYDFAKSGVDWDTVDKVFAPIPPPPAGTPAPAAAPAPGGPLNEVRSKNAKVQARDGGGRFVKKGGTVQVNGGRTAVVKDVKDDGSIDIETPDGGTENVQAKDVKVQEPKARLATPPAIVDNPAQLIDEYLAKHKAPEKDPPADGPPAESPPKAESKAPEKAPPKPAAKSPSKETAVQELADTPAAPAAPASAPAPAKAPPAEKTPTAPAPADDAGGNHGVPGDVPPLFFAVVDRVDPQAVLDLGAIVPAEGGGGEAEAYKRTKTKWEPAPELLADLRGSTPPAIVELDEPTLVDVMGQVDKSDATDDQEKAAPPAENAPPSADKAPPSAPAGTPPPAKKAPAPAAAPLKKGPVAASAASGVIHRYSVVYGGLIASATTYPVLPEVELAEGGVDQNRGNAERLRRYWTRGEGAGKIRWGEPNDWYRCVRHLSKYMGARAKGYCTLRHKDAIGVWPGQEDGGQGRGRAAALEELSSFAEIELLKSSPLERQTSLEYALSADEISKISQFKSVGGEKRKELANTGAALPDGSFPIETEGDVKRAVSAFGRASNKTQAKKHIIKRARAVGASVSLPEKWKAASIADALGHREAPGEGFLTGIASFNDLEEFYREPEAVAPVPAPRSELRQDDGAPDDVTEVAMGAKFRINLVVPENVESGDGRTFASDALSSRETPLPLMWQPQGQEGHNGSVIVGRIDKVEKTELGLGDALGVFDTGPFAQEAERLVRAGMLRGISADLDEFEADVLDLNGEETVAADRLTITNARLMGVTLVAKPAFQECTIELIDGGEPEEFVEETPALQAAALVAGAAPLFPPKQWFDDPALDKPTHLTVTDEGRVFGHVAAWDVDHIGLPFGTRAPRSASGYAYFQTGAIKTQEGAEVSVGQLTLAGGHAPLNADATAAVKHYDDTASAVADVAAGEDSHGIWVSGALRPGTTPEQTRVLRASSPSGDWRPIRGNLELVAVCQVNVPGFPVARARVASGQVYALVAAGASALAQLREDPWRDDIASRLSLLERSERERLEAIAASVRQRIQPVREERRRELSSKFEAAKARVASLRPEKPKVEPKDLRDRITAFQAAQPPKNELRDRLAALQAAGGLKVQPDFEEKKHPRDDEGKFREVLARLENMLKDAAEGKSGINKLQDAADAEDKGDREGASSKAKDAADDLQQASERADDTEVKAQLQEAARAISSAVDKPDDKPTDKPDAKPDDKPAADKPDAKPDAVPSAKPDVKPDAKPDARPDGPPSGPPGKPDDGGKGVPFDQLDEEVQRLLEKAGDRLQQTADPALDSVMTKLQQYISGGTNLSPEEISSIIERYLRQKTSPLSD